MYVFILVGIPALFLAGILILPEAAASYDGRAFAFLKSYPFLFVAIFFGGGPLGEEIGWRGFALPRLQARFGPLRASLILGLLWAFWHLPHFLTSAQRGGPGMSLSVLYFNLPVFLVMVVALSIVFTWVFNRTEGSLFIAMLLHASINTFAGVTGLFTASIVKRSDLPFMIVLVALALSIVILTRGRLAAATCEEFSQGNEASARGAFEAVAKNS